MTIKEEEKPNLKLPFLSKLSSEEMFTLVQCINDISDDRVKDKHKKMIEKFKELIDEMKFDSGYEWFEIKEKIKQKIRTLK